MQGCQIFKELVKKLISKPFVKAVEILFIVICLVSAACLYQSVDFFKWDTKQVPNDKTGSDVIAKRACSSRKT